MSSVHNKIISREKTKRRKKTKVHSTLHERMGESDQRGQSPACFPFNKICVKPGYSIWTGIHKTLYLTACLSNMQTKTHTLLPLLLLLHIVVFSSSLKRQTQCVSYIYTVSYLWLCTMQPLQVQNFRQECIQIQTHRCIVESDHSICLQFVWNEELNVWFWIFVRNNDNLSIFRVVGILFFVANLCMHACIQHTNALRSVCIFLIYCVCNAWNSGLLFVCNIGHCTWTWSIYYCNSCIAVQRENRYKTKRKQNQRNGNVGGTKCSLTDNWMWWCLFCCCCCYCYCCSKTPSNRK